MKQPFDVTLDNCHEEPIHIPGSIQSHGYLLAVEENTGLIQFCSENLAAHMGKEPASLIGQGLDPILGTEIATVIRDLSPATTLDTINPLAAQVPGQAGDLSTEVIISRNNDGLLLLDLEPEDNNHERRVSEFYHQVRRITASLSAIDDLDELYARTVTEVRNLTGLDRVMLYRFDAQFNGQVVAEAKRDDLNAFLHQHFPESDIPAQARALYIRNPIRMLADTEATPSPVYPQEPPLNLSKSNLRSVSPIHIQYLKNMGVRASLSISIVVEERLWGLIACHHYSPFVVPFQVREIAVYLSSTLSHLITLRTRAQSRVTEAKLLSINSTLAERIALEENFESVLVKESELLMQLVHADGVAWQLEGDLHTAGETPNVAEIADLFNWLTRQKNLSKDSIYSTASLALDNPAFEDLAPCASGILLLPISITERMYLIWFRKEVIHTKHWGGKPEKVIQFLDDGSHRLMPRASFELWREQVRFRAEDWHPLEITVAFKLRNTIINYVLMRAERLRAANTRLQTLVDERTTQLRAEIEEKELAQEELLEALAAVQATNKELELFAYVASHDLQEPLRKIQSFGNRLERECSDLDRPRAKDFLARMIKSANKMQTLIQDLLSFSRITTHAQSFKSISLAELLDELAADLEDILQQRGAQLTVGMLPDIVGDRGQLYRVFQNLILNSIKFGKADTPVEIVIDTEAAPTGFVGIRVQDNGIGFDPQYQERIFKLFERLQGRSENEGTGLGLAICQKIIQRHEGEISAEGAPGVGCTIHIQLPSASASEGR